MLARDQLGNCRGFSGSSLARLSRESPQKKVAFAFPELDRHHAPCSVFKTRAPGRGEVLSFIGRCTNNEAGNAASVSRLSAKKTFTFTCQCFLRGRVCATASLSTSSKIITLTTARCFIFQTSTPRRGEVIDFLPNGQKTHVCTESPSHNIMSYNII